MDDKKFLKVYKKGISYQYFNSALGIISFIIFFTLLRIGKYEGKIEILFKIVGFGVVFGIILIFIVTPIRWHFMQERFNNIMKKQQYNDNSNNK